MSGPGQRGTLIAPGDVVAAGPVAGRTVWAPALAEALAALHVPAPPDAPHNPFRGVPILVSGIWAADEM